VKVTLGDQSVTKTVHVEEDPRIEISAADRAKRYDAMMKAFALTTESTRTQQQIVSLKTAVDAALTAWKTRPANAKIPDNVQKAAEDFQKQVNAIAYKFVNPPEEGQEQGSAAPPLVVYAPTLGQRINGVYGGIQSVTAAPTPDELSNLDAFTKELHELQPQIQKLITEGLPALNKLMNDSSIPHIVIVPTAGGGGGRRGGSDN
jgi:hypothetical protein